MSAVGGFIALHLVLVLLGGVALWMLGFVDPFAGPRRGVLAAVGPAYVVGVALLMPWMVLVLLLHIPATFGVAAIVALLAIGAMLTAGARLGRVRATRPGRTRASADPAGRRAATGWRRVPPAALAFAAIGVFVTWATVVLAGLSTGGDDARIWSLRGLALADYSRLVPEIFLNQGQSGGHPIYPLLQPELEAMMSQAFGHPALSFFHAELWLFFVAAAWTAAYLLWNRRVTPPGPGRAAWLPAVALLAVIPAEVVDVIVGDADTTGSVLLALAVLCAGLWLDVGRRRFAALCAVLLAAAASTKDEDFTGALVVLAVLVVAGVVRAIHDRAGGRWRAHIVSPLAIAAYFGIVVAPWRLWVSAHHLIDGVTPPLPKALNPAYVLHRSDILHQALTAMMSQVLAEWDWLLAIFLVVCGIGLRWPGTRRIVWFYQGVFWLVVAALAWLFTTTPEPLSYLIQTAVGRTVAVFMVITPVGVAHLLAVMTDPDGEPVRAAQTA